MVYQIIYIVVFTRLIMSFKNIVLGIGIFVIFVFLVGYGIEAFYASPEYNKFCNNSINYPEKVYTMTCPYNTILEEQKQKCYNEEGQPVSKYNETGCETSITCDYCSKDYNNAQKYYTRNVFIICLIIGLIAMGLGAFLFKLETVGAGLMAGGVGTIFYGCVRNWPNFSNMMKFILLLIALILLILLGYKLNGKLKFKI